MKSYRYLTRGSLGVVTLLLLAGCNMPGGASGPAPGAEEPAAPPAATPTAKFEGSIPVGLPAERLDHAGDVDTSPNASRKAVTGGDVFVQGLYERPFNSDTMDKYFPYLDIVDFQGYKDDTWGYGTITLANTAEDGGLPGQYALELDLDRNGRGDWLVRANGPFSEDWSTRGVTAWNDANGDVGGRALMSPDNGAPGGTGYEVQVFDEGQGSLTDGAWARVQSADPRTVEIAFQLSMLGDPSSYAMGGWAGTNIDPVMFDHNDHMTHIQAGSPNPGYEVYPLKDLSEIDNTCRLAIGFAPTGKELGLCEVVQQKQAEGGAPCVPRGCAPNAIACFPVVCP
jgi:hypothetical protein